MTVKINYTGIYDKPKYETVGSAGIDLRNNTDLAFIIKPGGSMVIPTGVKIEIPLGYVGLLFPRSSLGFKFNTTLTNSVGVIDSDYRGEIKAKVINHGKENVTIKAGDRFCQLVIVPFLQADLEFVDTLSETERGEGGFGSTNRK